MISNSEFLIFDGAMGTMLQKRGLKTGELPEMLNFTAADTILSIHKEYVAAGADVVSTNTFGANSHKMGGKAEVAEVVTAAVNISKQSGAKYVALDVGPTGALLKPMGSLDFEEAVDIFKEQISAGAVAGADIVIIETMSDLLETKAAVIAAKECCNLPVIASMSYQENGRTFLGVDAAAATVTLCSLGVSAVGINCSLGPDKLLPIVETITKYATVPVIVQANAGLPSIVDGETVFNISAESYAQSVAKMIDMGVSVIGGCCGTTPEYISKIKSLTAGKKPVHRDIKHRTAFTSPRSVVVLDDTTAIIGERINPTGKKKLKEALRSGDIDYVIDEALNQQDCGADVLDVNAGLPDIDEKEVLCSLVREIQAVTNLPLQIDSSDAQAVEGAVRIYNGKPIINSVNGSEESMNAILPIVKKYGTAVVALTLDENGIPKTAEGRLEIAKKIVARAVEMGIPYEDVLIDCLVLTASTNQDMVLETIKAVRLVKSELGLKTVLGVSNVSFGLPNRELVNSVFLAAAFGAGLDMPILNPMSENYMKVVSAFKVLHNEDRGAVNFIGAYADVKPEAAKSEELLDVVEIIKNGRRSNVQPAVEKMLQGGFDTMTIINEYFIPALDEVGKKFESGEFFLPQLMAAAETAKGGFDVLRLAGEKKLAQSRGKILIATVKGDIHDIGKNIVRMLLENYGYEIIDLGKDVEPEIIAEAAEKSGVKLVGLSALMTTTVKYMGRTIEALRSRGVDCKVMVGGAVLNEEYAKLVGADYYAKDASEAARIAAEIFL